MFARNTLAHWLIDVEGIDGRTASRIIAMDRRGYTLADIKANFDAKTQAKILRAHEGLFCVNNDC